MTTVLLKNCAWLLGRDIGDGELEIKKKDLFIYFCTSLKNTPEFLGNCELSFYYSALGCILLILKGAPQIHMVVRAPAVVCSFLHKKTTEPRSSQILCNSFSLELMQYLVPTTK